VARAAEAVTNGKNETLLSVVSAWEICIKHASSKLQLPIEASQYVAIRLRANQITALPLQLEHTLCVCKLPPHHRDPFDRLLVAVSQVGLIPNLRGL
jgi:PIN domain nuclease of toxin-antitoxin system